MLFTSSPQSVADSRRFSPREHIAKLAECDRVLTYSECGYFCVAGYRNGDRVVHAHMNSRDEFQGALSGSGYRLGFDTLERMSESEIREARRLAGGKRGYGRW